jgi:hypothetical protein
MATDSDGHLASLSGGANGLLKFIDVSYNGIDYACYPNAAKSGTWRFFYSYLTSGGAPTVTLRDFSNSGFLLGALTIVSSTVVGPRTEVWATATIDTGDLTPNHPAGRYYSAAVGLQVAGNAIGPDLQILDPQVPSDWTSRFHPSLFGWLEGNGFKSLRFMNSASTIDSHVVEFDDFPVPATVGTLAYRSFPGANVVSFDPLVFDGSDDAGTLALSWFWDFTSDFPFESGWAYVKVTLDADIPVADGHLIQFFGADTLRTHGSMTAAARSTRGDRTSHSASTLTPSCAGCSRRGRTRPPATRTRSRLRRTRRHRLQAFLPIGQGIPPLDQCRFANELGIDPWICIPHLASDDCATQLGTLWGTNLDADRTLRVEYSNEPWNTLFSQYGYFKFLAFRGNWLLTNGSGGFSHVGEPSRAGYVHRYIPLIDAFRAAFRAARIAAGNDPDSLIRVLGSQRAGPNNTEWALQQFNVEHIGASWGNTDRFDEMCIDDYQDNDEGYFRRGGRGRRLREPPSRPSMWIHSST